MKMGKKEKKKPVRYIIYSKRDGTLIRERRKKFNEITMIYNIENQKRITI